jgi:hypothetical protein
MDHLAPFRLEDFAVYDSESMGKSTLFISKTLAPILAASGFQLPTPCGISPLGCGSPYLGL